MRGRLVRNIKEDRAGWSGAEQGRTKRYEPGLCWPRLLDSPKLGKVRREGEVRIATGQDEIGHDRT